MAHQFELIKLEINELRAQNAAHKERKSRKRKRLQTGGILTSEQAEAIEAATAGSAKSQQLNANDRGSGNGSSNRQRRCRQCREAGHNSRTCEYVKEEASKLDTTAQDTLSDSSVE
jgi:hypothetical protein